MKLKSIVPLSAALLLSSNAWSQNWFSRFEYEADPDAFRAKEWQFDVFGAYASLDRDDFIEDTWGVGVGGNYFFTDKLGAGLDTYVTEVDAPKHVDASFIGRYPLYEKYYLSLAPYGMVGAGRQFEDRSQWTAHIGLGAEFRFNATTGAFLDYRRVFATDSSDIDLWRFGFRFVF